MNDFLPGCLFAVDVIKCFMIGVNVLVSVLGTTKHSSCNQRIDTWQSTCIVLYLHDSAMSWPTELRIGCERRGGRPGLPRP